MSRSAANELGYPEVNVTTTPAPDFWQCSCVTLTSRLKSQKWILQKGAQIQRRLSIGWLEVRTLARLVLHAHTHTRKAPHKFDLEQHLNDSVTPKLASSESDKLSGDPIYTTSTMTSTSPTNFGVLTETKRGPFLANNSNFEPYFSFDNTGGSGSSVSQGMYVLQPL